MTTIKYCFHSTNFVFNFKFFYHGRTTIKYLMILNIVFTRQVLYSILSFFIKGILLAENVLMATEMVHGYNRRSISRRGMLKVDLKKAFDSIRWDFILATLRAIEFPEQYIIWIEECITTPTFSVTVNGVSDGYYKSTKGLRQGDPLSPYLFVLAMEVFSRLLSSRFNSGLITYHPKAAETDLSHLMFADDVMIFFDGGAASLHSITETLDDFASWSGLQVNREKSELFLAGLSTQETTEIARYEYPIGKSSPSDT